LTLARYGDVLGKGLYQNTTNRGLYCE